jgi:hypothetical protein
MKRFTFAAATALSLSTALSAPATAEPISSLEECYNKVITWCVENFPEHADECGNASGLDACDEVFGAYSGAQAILHTRPGDPIARLRVISNARPSLSGGDDDNGRERDGGSRGDGGGTSYSFDPDVFGGDDDNGGGAGSSAVAGGLARR